MKHQARAALVLLLVMGAPAIAQAFCEFSFSEVRQENQRPYSMFSPGTSIIEMAINVQSNDCTHLAFTFKSSHGNTLVGPEGEIPYQLKSFSGRNIDINGVSSVSGRELLSHSPGTALRMRAFIMPGSFAGPGLYNDSVSVLAHDGQVVLDEINVPITLQVSPEADISLTGASSTGYSSNGGGGINFGRLKPGKERSAFLFVRSNVHYALNISSENQGYLVHRYEMGEQARIPYAAWLDNQRLKLETQTTVQSGGMTPIYRSRPHKLAARIEPFRDKLAGNYHDSLLIEIVFLE